MGFYIALLVCVTAAGVVGYFALRSEPEETVPTVENEPIQQESTVTAATQETTPVEPVIAQHSVVVTTPTVGSAKKTTEDTTETAAPAVIQEEEPEATWQVVWPLAGETVATFSLSELRYDATLGDWRTHDGLDIQADALTEVVSAAAGTVVSVTEDNLLGNMVVIDHGNGYVTTYASLHPETEVEEGDTVAAGQAIGAVSNTSLTEAALGAHLHFAVEKDGVSVDPEELLG
jgi:murein DD-endopeptidase MepM/ murein hydrolase activator NlpD